MRRLFCAPAIVLAVLGASERARADSITLDQAVARAARRPAVGMAGEDVAAAKGLASRARRPTYNPELGAAVGPRFAGGATGVEVEASLAQTIELGGKRAARAAAADARVRASDAELAIALREAQLETRRAFHLALIANARLDAAREAEALATQIDAATKERQKLGSGTQLEINLATAELGRARHERNDAENDYEASLVALATAVGAGPEERLEPTGDLPALAEARWSEEDLIARAIAGRPEVLRVRAEREAAAADVRLADANGKPDVTLGLSYGFEQDPDADAHTVLVSASIPLPFRNRNQGERSASRARLRRAEIDDQRQRDTIVRETRLAVRTYAKARDAVMGFDADVNARLHDNLELARESFASGKIDYFEFNIVRRELIANRAAYLDALAEAIDAWHTLLRASGEEQVP